MKMDDRIEITVQEGYVVLLMSSHTSMALVYILSSKWKVFAISNETRLFEYIYFNNIQIK